MTTYRGLDGFLAVGGVLTGSPEVKTTLATGATELNVTGGGSTLTGLLMLGDIFTLGGETDTPKYRVKTSCYAATGTAILATIPFEPGVSEEIAVAASLTVQANSMAEAKLWTLTAGAELIDSTVLGDAWRTFHATATQLGTWSGRGEAYLDMADVEQASLINAIASPANLLDDPLEFSNWSYTYSPVITTNQADPFGGTAARLLDDDADANPESINQTCIFTTDGTKGVSLYVKEGTSPINFIEIYDDTSNTSRFGANVNWVDNVPVMSTYINSPNGNILAPEDMGGGWFRIEFQAQNCVAAASNYMRIAPCNWDASSNVGTMYAYGAKVADMPIVGHLYPPQVPAVAILAAVGDDKQFYGECRMSNVEITAQEGELVTITFDYTGVGVLRPNWT